jgi:hypothetical protein
VTEYITVGALLAGGWWQMNRVLFEHGWRAFFLMWASIFVLIYVILT